MSKSRVNLLSRAAMAGTLLSLTVIPITLIGCTKQPTFLGEHKLEVERIRNVAYSALREMGDALDEGRISGAQYSMGADEIWVIHANTLKFIDGNPKYEKLYSRLWSDGRPPSLAWHISEDDLANDATFHEYLFG